MTADSTITNYGTQPNVIATVDGVTVTTGTATAVGNYLVTTANGKLKIERKEVTITANSKDKKYDGKPLTEAGFTHTDLETDDGHKFTVTMTDESTVTNVSSVANIIASVDGVNVTTNTPVAIGNYLVTTVDGKLHVYESETVLTITANSNTWTYDGVEHTDGGYTVEYDT